jgi:flagellar basal body L-ring protein FlgH
MVLATIVVLVATGCSSTPAEVGTIPQKERKLTVENKTVTREPGSIWTSLSDWNSVFTDWVPRKSGDVLKVRLTAPFRSEVAKKLKMQLPQSADSGMGENFLSASMDEVLARGVYSVSGTRELRFVDEKIRFRFSATVREKDIVKDDSLSWDDLFNLNWSAEKLGKIQAGGEKTKVPVKNEPTSNVEKEDA